MTLFGILFGFLIAMGCQKKVSRDRPLYTVLFYSGVVSLGLSVLFVLAVPILELKFHATNLVNSVLVNIVVGTLFTFGLSMSTNLPHRRKDGDRNG